MILIGMFDSPFVRRVAVSMQLLGVPFEHRNWSVGRDFDSIREFNPLGRVPCLVLPDGETLIESAAILDFLDEQAGPEGALLPRSGRQRRDALKILAIATGAAEKAVTQVYETVFRPADKRHAPWLERCRLQVGSALAELNRLAQARPGGWLIGERLGQCDITATCAYTFVTEALALDRAAEIHPALASLAARCEALPQFQAVRAPWFPPGGSD
jgi:glutathione S-transferase